MVRVSKSELSASAKDILAEIPTVKNRYGIQIKKACLSCDRKQVNSLGIRTCSLTGKKVDKYGMCKNWLLSDSLERTGAGGGTIKPYEYYVEKGYITPPNEKNK